MGDIHTIVIPENVELNYEIAGIGSRFVALLLDTLVQVLISGVLVIALLALFGFKTVWNRQITDLATGITTFILLILLFIVLIGYHIILETIMNGQTLGKKLLQIRVRKEQGNTLTFWDILLRNSIRLVDILPSFYIIGLIVMFVNKKSKRLGDFAAGTIVIKEISRKNLRQFLTVNQLLREPATAPETFTPQYIWINSVLTAITQPDYLLMKNLFSRRRELSNFKKLAAGIIQKIINKASLPEGLSVNPNEAETILREMIELYEKIYF